MAMLDLPLIDLGGFPLVFDSVRSTVRQDPALGGTNVYGPGDVFKEEGSNRLVYWEEAVQMGTSRSAPPFTPAPQVPAAPADPSDNTGAQVGKGLGAAAETTIDQLWKFLKRPIWPDDPRSLPTGLLVIGGVVGYQLLLGKRRR